MAGANCLVDGSTQPVYADNAATSPMDPEALRAMQDCIVDNYANPSQPYRLGRSARKALESAREMVAHCIGADSDEIYFTSGGSESNNWAIKCTSRFNGRKTTVASRIEHHSVINVCRSMARCGENISYVDADGRGYIHPDSLESVLNSSVRMTSTMFANNEVGTLEPISDLCAIAHRAGSVFHTDAVQAVGHVPINVHELDVDLLSASAHKFNGPRGAGFLYIREGTDIEPLIDGGGQENSQRSGTENVAAAVAMAIALKNNVDSMEKNAQKLRDYEAMILGTLGSSDIEYYINGGEKHIPGLISISFDGYDGEAILHRLDLKGICVSTGSACDGSRHNDSHVLSAMNLSEGRIRGTVRISLGKYNTLGDVQSISDGLVNILKSMESTR